jgi:hypothetical protein
LEPSADGLPATAARVQTLLQESRPEPSGDSPSVDEVLTGVHTELELLKLRMQEDWP